MHDKDPARQFLFLIASARRDGNSEILAGRAAQNLPAGAAARWLRLADLPLPAFQDVRHEADGIYAAPEGHGRTLLDATLAASDLVFVAPVYWYSLPAAAKLYLDHWSGWMRVPGLDFRARMASKTLWAIGTTSSEDVLLAEPFVQSLRLTADYMRMAWGGALLGYGNRAGDVLADTAALAKAAGFFSKAEAADRPAA